MKNKIFLILLLLSSNLIAQNDYALWFDADGIQQYGPVLPFLYRPKSKIEVPVKISEFEKGMYQDTNGKIHEGFIAYDGRKLKYKKTKYATQSIQKLDVDDILSFKMSTDSFFVADNISLNLIGGKRQILQHLITVDESKFAKLFLYKPALNSIEEHILAKNPEDDLWQSLSENTDEKLRTWASKYFQAIPEILTKELSKEEKNIDLEKLIRLSKYKSSFNQNSPIYFTRFWQETNQVEYATYIAKINSISDSTWHLTFYENENKFLEGSFSSLFPITAFGELNIFSKEGKVIKSYHCSRIGINSTSTFYRNGKKFYQCSYKKSPKPGSTRLVRTLQFESVNDSLGVSQNLKNASLTCISTQDRMLEFIFTEQELSSVKSTDGLYQFNNQHEHFNLQKLSKKLNSSFSNRIFREAQYDKVKGILLVQMRFDDKGLFVDYAKLNELYPSIDLAIEKFLNTQIKDRFKLQKYRHLGEKVGYEVVVPFFINVDRSNVSPIKSLYDTPWWHNNWWFHQQMINNHNQLINNIEVPRINVPKY